MINDYNKDVWENYINVSAWYSQQAMLYKSTLYVLTYLLVDEGVSIS